EQHPDAAAQVGAGLGAHAAQGLGAEQRLEEPLRDGAVAALDGHVGRAVAEQADHQDEGDRLCVEGDQFRDRALGDALGADQLLDVVLPGADGPADAARQLRGDVPEVGVGPGEDLAPGRVLAPAGDDLLGAVLRRRHDQRFEAGAQRRLEGEDAGGAAAAAAPGGAAAPPPLDVQGLQQVAGAGELLPAGEDLAAQEGAVAGGLVQLGEGGAVGGLDLPGQLGALLDLRLDLPGELGDAGAEAVEDGGEGVADDDLAVLGVLGDAGQPGAEVLDGLLGEPAVLDAGLGNGEAAGVADLVLVQHLAEVLDDLGALRARALRDARQHDADGGAVLLGALEHL